MSSPDQSKNGAQLLQAAGHGRLETVRELLAGGLPVNTANDVGCTALMSACASYRTEVASFLLGAGADVSIVTKAGQTALHTAVGSTPSLPEKQQECVRLLLDHGARVDASDNNGITPLMQAAWFGCALAVQELLRHGASFSVRDRQGRTAEDLARLKNRAEVLQILRARQ